MSENPFHRAIYLTGPTASGKTAIALALARRLDAEIVALDSMTVYRGLDVGTAKPTPEERAQVPHHLIDVVDPWCATSVAEYRAMAQRALEDIEARGRRALFVGGTALYLKALLRGLFNGPGANPELRRQLEAEAEEQGDAAMHGRLAALDPVTAARLHPNDRRRVVRALEVIAATGEPLSLFHNEHDLPAPPNVPVFALERPRPQLHERIHRRVDQMFADGLVAEVRRLMEEPRPLHEVPAGSVGYREVIDHLRGLADRDATVTAIKTRTRQFAKRQETWFRGLTEVRRYPFAEGADAEAVAQELASRIEAIRASG